MAHVMIVDDSPTVLMSMEGLLRRFGHTVTSANSAEDAVEKLRAGDDPKMLITDLHMPGKNGIELIGFLRQHPDYRFTPMLMLTTESQQERRDQAKKAGATGWLTKPVDHDQLEAALKKLLPAE
jgi:two-component system chemotaxis response regulator CheY